MRTYRAIVLAVLAGTVCCCLPLGAAAGNYSSQPLGGATADRFRPSIAGDALFPVVAWEENGHVWTEHVDLFCQTPPPLAVNHGIGSCPVLGQLADGSFVLAWLVRPDSLAVTVGDGAETWQDIHWILVPDRMDANTRLDLWTSDDPDSPTAWLTLDAGPLADRTIFFVSGGPTEWSSPVPVVGGLSVGVFPQITSREGPSTSPLPTIFYVQSESGLWRTDGMGETWLDPVQQTGPDWDFDSFGNELDVVADPDGGWDLLAVGLQPVCPCNRIRYAHCNSSWYWSSLEDLTVEVEAYNWPSSPHLAYDRDGHLHAFWYQLGSDPYMAPHSTRLFHRIHGDGVWMTEESGLPGPECRGIAPAIALAPDNQGHVLAAWAERDTIGGVTQPQEIWIRTWAGGTNAPATPPRVATARIDARPNPFNPSVTVTVTAPVRPLRVEIVDARGRRVATLPVSSAGGERWRGQWNGRDSAGRAVPSGVYMVRATLPGGSMARAEITLAR